MSIELPTVYVVGDVMLDVTIDAKAYRLDQETHSVHVLPRCSPGHPVPAGATLTFAPGGAANVAMNLRQLSCSVTLISRFGNDPYGRALGDILDDNGIGYVRRHNWDEPSGTTVKSRYYADGKLVGRVDQDVDSTAITAVPDHLDRPDAIILTDYGRGALDRGAIDAWCSRWPGVAVYADPKVGRMGLWENCHGLDTFVLNRHEAADFVANEFPSAVVRRLAAFTSAPRVALKLGPEGSVLWNGGPEDTGYHRIPKIVPEGADGVIDVQGAGDTYIAAMVAARCRGVGPVDACMYASAAAGTAVCMKGTAAPTREQVAATMRHRVMCRNRGVMDFEHVVDLANRLRAFGMVVGYTGGCFDVRLTEGHIHTVTAAAKQCDFLFVGVDSDKRVRKLKGPDRPIVSEAERATVMSLVRGVGAVFVFNVEPAEVVHRLRPNVLFKGGNYTAETMPEIPELEAAGGRFVHVGVAPCSSTTEFIQKLQRSTRT